jgi:hypothetical protein
MALEFNVTAAHRFFLGEDKQLDLQIFDSTTTEAMVLAGTGVPFNVAGLTLIEWSLKKKDKDPDPPIIGKSLGSGLSVIGVFAPTQAANTQRVRVTFPSDETDPFVTSLLATPYKLKAGVAYRHSLKRRDGGNENILTFGSFTFKQATEP